MKFTPFSETLSNNTPTIKVYDAMMGQGKTQKIISNIQKTEHNQKFIYITPLLSEAHRIAGTTYDKDDSNKKPLSCPITREYIYTKDAPLKDRRFKHPHYSYSGGKAQSLPNLIKNKENIATTHQLFVNLTQELLEGVQDYILIVDEALEIYQVLKEYPLSEINTMLDNKWLSIGEDKCTLTFHRENYAPFRDKEGDSTHNTYYSRFATLCDLKQVTLIDGKVIVWELPDTLLRAFKEVWIGTYLFEGSLFSLYLKNRGIPYTVEKFGKKPSEIKHLINLYDSKKKGNLNEIGEDRNALCSSDYKRSRGIEKGKLSVVATCLDSFFRSNKAKKADRIFTCFKPDLNTVGKKYKDQWLNCNIKATNDYRETHNVAYLCNIYPIQDIAKTASKKGNSFSQEQFALSEMVQFIFRSAIRQGEAINLYIPSSRMRAIFQNWLNDEYEDLAEVEANEIDDILAELEAYQKEIYS